MLTCRRFLALSAAMTLPHRGEARTPHIATGHALGANATRVMEAPPFELLECLPLAGHLHAASKGRFDPTLRPLWALHARATTERRAPTWPNWRRLRLEAGLIQLEPGMALTLNSVAQGYSADQVTALLLAEGLSLVLIDIGELRARVGPPNGDGWPVRQAGGDTLTLHYRALATSAPLGTCFDAADTLGHSLDPATSQLEPPIWRNISIMSPSATVADGLSTAACLEPNLARLDQICAAFPGASIACAEPC